MVLGNQGTVFAEPRRLPLAHGRDLGIGDRLDKSSQIVVPAGASGPELAVMRLMRLLRDVRFIGILKSPTQTVGPVAAKLSHRVKMTPSAAAEW